MTIELISRSTKPPELLLNHSKDVGERTETFASAFGASSAGLWSGVLHDLGKAKCDVQAMLQGRTGKTTHAAEGAVRIAKALTQSDPVSARCLSHVIAGHHAGLHNGGDLDGVLSRAEASLPSDPSWLKGLLRRFERPAPLTALEGGSGFAMTFYTRMAFSALVDADRSSAAALPSDERDLRSGIDPFIDAHAGRIDALRRRTSASTDLATFRNAVMDAAIEAADRDPGLFSMTVPTGGGKTLASLGFALAHARAKGLRRILYVAPFTAVVEQLADEIRKAINDADAVIEHHSALDTTDETDEVGSVRRQAEERWDAPIVITTAVQFFESLFSASPARCRKLHRLAQSVVILDEAQALPRHVLRPCLAAMTELSRAYGASLVLMTATQPRVRVEDGFRQPEALRGVREIGPPPDLLRPAPRMRTERLGEQGDADLHMRIAETPRSLTILNNRRHARELFDLARAGRIDGLVHLSTAMMPAHRRLVLDRVRATLANGAPCRLISTSVVEAGVDVDFPVVLRAMAGLDQIVQAAGRCNREGRLGPEGGTLFLFDVAPGAGRSAPPSLRRLAEETRAVLDRPLREGASASLDPLGDEALRRFFENLYAADADGLDTTAVKTRAMSAPTVGVMKALRDVEFNRLPLASIGSTFKLIDEAGVPVVVPDSYGIGAPAGLLEELRTAEQARGLARRLQPFCVSVPRAARARMLVEGHLTIWRDDDFGRAFPVMTAGLVARSANGASDRPTYDAETGLNWTSESYWAGEANII